MTLTRAYSLLTVKSVDDEKRIITGLATSIEPDRTNDIVEPLGVRFKNPLPLLLYHDSRRPVGTARFLKPTKDGIEFEAQIPNIEEPGPLRDRVQEAWLSIKNKLLRGVSIGFRSLERALLDNGGTHYLKSEVLELSLVVIPAHQLATIQTIKSLDDSVLRAASGTKRNGVVHLNPPGASGSKTPAKEAIDVKTIAEQIREWEAKRQAKAARMEEIMSKSGDAGTTLDTAESEEYDTVKGEVEQIDKHLARLGDMQKVMIAKAKPVAGNDPEEAAGSREPQQRPYVQVLEQKLEKGIGFARLIKAKALALLDQRSVDDVAKDLWPNWDGLVRKNVAAGNTVSTNWLKPLYDGATQTLANEFAEFLRPETIIGKFGTGNIPSLNRVPFNVRFARQTTKGSAAWVGEGLPKPVTEFQVEMVTLTQNKVAGISVVTEELLRNSAPSAEAIIRNELAAAVVERIDLDFIDPANSGTSTVKPASITNGSFTAASSGDTLAAIVADILVLSAPMTQANMKGSGLVWIMNENVARALSLTFTANGVRQFPDLAVGGGTFLGYPVIVSQYVPEAVVVLVSAPDIMLADDGVVSIAVSREASIEMLASGSSQTAITGTGASLVSMFQTNSVAVRAEREICWIKKRTQSVAYLTSVNWSGTAGSGDL